MTIQFPGNFNFLNVANVDRAAQATKQNALQQEAMQLELDSERAKRLYALGKTGLEQMQQNPNWYAANMQQVMQEMQGLGFGVDRLPPAAASPEIVAEGFQNMMRIAETNMPVSKADLTPVKKGGKTVYGRTQDALGQEVAGAAGGVARTWINPDTQTMWALGRDGVPYDTGVAAQQFAQRPIETAGGTGSYDPGAGTVGGVIPGTEAPAMRQREAADKAAVEAAQTEAQIRTKREVEKELGETENILASQSKIAEIDNLISNIDKAGDFANWWSTGLFGQMTGGIAGTPAYNLRAQIKPVQAALAFGRLQQMRDESKTGGALGQVSNIELGLLMSAIDALDPNLPDDLLVQNFQNVRRHYENVRRLTVARQLVNSGMPFAETPQDAAQLSAGTQFVDGKGYVRVVPGG